MVVWILSQNGRYVWWFALKRNLGSMQTHSQVSRGPSKS